ncbi:MAG TPA: phosphoglucosamine mutase [Blastocatellia bacterium]|nr:phosphoglucosamine mutase [Blastocatellia bacterium]
MKPLKIGIGGVRGIVGETFTPELAVSFAQAFATYLDSGRILVCRDTRPSGPMLASAVAAGLLAAGCEVIDLGVCPTPSLQLAVPFFQAQGGIAVTAGHNPAPWNALKFVRGDGIYLNATQADELLDIFHQGEFVKATWDTIKTGIEMREAISHHIEVLKNAFDVEAIRARRFTVAVDCCNGACSLLTPRWLAELGCEVLAINDDPSAPFPHNPEPRRETMAQLRAVIKAGRADIGFAHDADGERLGLVTDRGEPLSEEMTLAIATAIKLEQKAGTVVTNVSTSSIIDRVAERHAVSVVRTPVGQAYVSEAMLACGAVIGGEGSGGVAVPEVQVSNDSAATIGLVLEHLAKTGDSMSALTAQLPKVTMMKRNVAVEPNRIYSLLQGFRREIEAEGADADEADGIKVFRADGGWVHVRASNTESMIRIIAEAADEKGALDLLSWAQDRLKR